MRFIFDLDGTVIDSSHRHATLENGNLDLAHWIENSTPEKVMQDSLLPLANEWRDIMQRGGQVVVCTARVMGEADYRFLRENDLYARAILSRPAGNTLPDYRLKEILLRQYAASQYQSFNNFARRATVFDDNLSVLNHLQSLGFRVYNATSINGRLAA